LKQLRGKDVQLPASMLSSSLIIRDSTGPAPKKKSVIGSN
jgi:LacI family transcriptional regulator